MLKFGNPRSSQITVILCVLLIIIMMRSVANVIFKETAPRLEKISVLACSYWIVCHFVLFILVTEQTLVADDKQAGAFGPGARDLKIRNLRTYLFHTRAHLLFTVQFFQALYFRDVMFRCEVAADNTASAMCVCQISA